MLSTVWPNTIAVTCLGLTKYVRLDAVTDGIIGFIHTEGEPAGAFTLKKIECSKQARVA